MLGLTSELSYEFSPGEQVQIWILEEMEVEEIDSEMEVLIFNFSILCMIFSLFLFLVLLALE